MKTRIALTAAIGGLLALTGCKSTQVAGVTPPGTPNQPTLPITTNGRVLAFKATAKTTSTISAFNKLPDTFTELKGAKFLDKSAATGIRITGSAEADPAPNTNQGSTTINNGIANLPALITAKAEGTMLGGTSLVGLDKVKGTVYFENGSFGNPQVSSDRANLSTVGVYNLKGDSKNQIKLEHGATVRYSDGATGATEGNFAVGYIGENTTNMPGSGTAEYKGFWEQGIAAYDTGTEIKQMYMSGDVTIKADFGAGKVSGGLRNGKLETYDTVTHTARNLNTNITGLDIDATISGAEYNGSAKLIDTAGNQIGSSTSSNLIGAFLGDSAKETVAAAMIEGRAPLDGRDSDFILTGVMGGVKK